MPYSQTQTQTAAPNLPVFINDIIRKFVVCIIGGVQGCRGFSAGVGGGNDNGRVMGGSFHQNIVAAVYSSGFKPRRSYRVYIETEAGTKRKSAQEQGE